MVSLNILVKIDKDIKRYFCTKPKIHILDIITNVLKLELDEIPKHNNMPLHPLSKNKTKVISIEIKKLPEKKVIKFSRPEVNELISGVLTRGKKDGNKRMVLNFKRFKKFVNYEHFKINRLTMSYISYNLMHIWYQLVWKMHFSQHKFMRVIKNVLNSILIIYFSSFV